jgi:hypothetical protein
VHNSSLRQLFGVTGAIIKKGEKRGGGEEEEKRREKKREKREKRPRTVLPVLVLAKLVAGSNL